MPGLAVVLLTVGYDSYFQSNNVRDEYARSPVLSPSFSDYGHL